jgi:hypothetical protein
MTLMLLLIVFCRNPFDGRPRGIGFLVDYIINQYSCDISFIDVCCDYHCICAWEGYELDISFGEKYRHV